MNILRGFLPQIKAIKDTNINRYTAFPRTICKKVGDPKIYESTIMLREYNANTKNIFLESLHSKVIIKGVIKN